jgi:hypothetical protein
MRDSGDVCGAQECAGRARTSWSLRLASAEDLLSQSDVAAYVRTAAQQPKSARGFQIEIKESKTPGDEHCLNPPGAELAWFENQPGKFTILVAVLRYNHFIDQHVVAVFDVVNANLRIFSDFRSFDHFSI